MRREGRLRGKPTNKSRRTGRRCRSVERPREKAWAKRKHRCKRFAADVHANPDLADFFLQEPVRILIRNGEEDVSGSNFLSCVGARLATVNGVIEAALGELHGHEGEMPFTSQELGNAMDDIAAIELAFQQQFGIFENAVEGSSFSEFATQGWSTLSEESWSEVELDSDEDDEDDEDEDWAMVDHIDGAEAGE